MDQADARPFRVHARHVDHHHARIVTEASFEAAAVAYLEDFPAPAPEDDEAVSVIVQDLVSGRQHCFMVDLETGETRPCA